MPFLGLRGIKIHFVPVQVRVFEYVQDVNHSIQIHKTI